MFNFKIISTTTKMSILSIWPWNMTIIWPWVTSNIYLRIFIFEWILIMVIKSICMGWICLAECFSYKMRYCMIVYLHYWRVCNDFLILPSQTENIWSIASNVKLGNWPNLLPIARKVMIGFTQPLYQIKCYWIPILLSMVLDYSSTSFGDIPIKHSSELDGSPACRKHLKFEDKFDSQNWQTYFTLLKFQHLVKEICMSLWSYEKWSRKECWYMIVCKKWKTNRKLSDLPCLWLWHQ